MEIVCASTRHGAEGLGWEEEADEEEVEIG